MVVVVAAGQADAAIAMLAEAGETATRVGIIEPGPDGSEAAVRVDNLGAGWPG
jgi:phosphoribosylformylglycinamidine cyclo-ligase